LITKKQNNKPNSETSDKNPEMSAEQSKYQTIIDARNFHYKNFLNWSTYFSVIVGALFVALYTIIGSDKLSDIGRFGYSTLIALIGYIVSLAWHWSNKGYNYWWNHWAVFLTELEKEKDVNGKVYSMFYDTGSNFFGIVKPANYSTSRIATFISFCIAVAWGYLLLQMGCCFLDVNNGYCEVGHINVCCIALFFFISLIVTWLVMPIISMFFLQTNIDGHWIWRKGVVIAPQDRKECVKCSCETFRSGESIWDKMNKDKKQVFKKIGYSVVAVIICAGIVYGLCCYNSKRCDISSFADNGIKTDVFLKDSIGNNVSSRSIDVKKILFSSDNDTLVVDVRNK